MKKRRFILMDEKDSVATALESAGVGEDVEIFFADNTVFATEKALEEIPFGNKIALNNIEKGDLIYKYGAEIGLATEDIKKGSLVHVHNVKSQTVDLPDSVKKAVMKQLKIKIEKGRGN